MLRFAALLAPFAMITACTSPSPGFVGTERRDITVAGTQFAVFHRADKVQVIRTSREILPRRNTDLTRAAQAIETATGCSVRPRSMKGDQAVITAELDCRG